MQKANEETPVCFVHKYTQSLIEQSVTTVCGVIYFIWQ